MIYLVVLAAAVSFSFGILSVAVAFRMGSRWAQTHIENNIRKAGVALLFGVADDKDPGEGGMIQ